MFVKVVSKYDEQEFQPPYENDGLITKIAF